MSAVVEGSPEGVAPPAADARPAENVARSEWIVPALALGSVALALALRWLYVTQSWRIDGATFPMFLGDEGVHGLMGRHILAGNRPVFYYGSYYLGALDAYLTALLFAVFEPGLAALRAVPGLYALLVIPVAWGIARRLYGPRAGWLAAALVALPARFVFEWGSLAICGFGAYVLSVLLLLHLWLGLARRVTWPRLAGLGFLAGLALWNNGLFMPYALVVGIALWLWVPLTRRQIAVMVAAMAVGLAPLVYGNIVFPLVTARQLARKVVYAWTLGKQHLDREDDAGLQYDAHPLLEVVGVQQAKDGDWSLVGLAAAALLVAGAVGSLRNLSSARRREQSFRDHAVLYAFVAVGLGLGVGGWVGQPVGRYQLPLYSLLAIASTGWWIRSAPRAAVPVVALVVLVHAGLIARPLTVEGRAEPSRVLDVLQAHGLRHGYSAGPMYDLVFRSGESVVLVPLDHSRYPPYEALVDRAEEIFYVYRDDQERKPAHRAFMKLLDDSGVEVRRRDVDGLHVLDSFEPREAVSSAAIARVREEFRSEKFGR